MRKRRETRLEKKINESLEYFKRAYMKYGYFRLDYGKGLGTEDSPDYYEAVDNKNMSKIVGNSVFSPRIRRVPVYLNNNVPYQGWQIPDHYEWALSIHPRLRGGVGEIISPRNMREIKIDPRSMSNEELLDMIKDFLMLSNEEVMKRFKIDTRIFSEESLRKMEEMDERNLLLNKTEIALDAFNRLSKENKTRRGKPQNNDDIRLVV